MRYSAPKTLAAITTCFLFTLGCGSSEKASVAFQNIVPVDVSKNTPQDIKPDKQSSETDLPEKQVTENPKKQFILAKFQPPYPNRVNPFAPPTRSTRQAQRSGNSESSVVLLGFAKLDEPKAILNIDGVVSPLANGDQHAGVQVISIEPPNAVLQRGRDRWTASIN